LFIRPRLRHGLTAGPGSKVRTLDTKFRIRQSALRRACLQQAPFQARVDPRVVVLLEAMLAEARSHGVLTTEFCQTLFTQLLLVLLRREPMPAGAARALPVSGPAGEPDLCGRIERFLRENCAQKIDQQNLGTALRLSYRHLHETWRKRHRVSPLQSLWLFRVERATHLIRYSDYDLKRIAELTGFASVHHFTRVFTREMGVAPARWRERERNGVRQDVIINPGFINAALTIQGSPVPPAAISPGRRRRR